MTTNTIWDLPVFPDWPFSVLFIFFFFLARFLLKIEKLEESSQQAL